MNKEEVFEKIKDNKTTLLYAIGLIIAILLLIGGIISAYKVTRGKTIAAVQVFPVQAQEPFVFATNSVLVPPDTTLQQELQPAEQAPATDIAVVSLGTAEPAISVVESPVITPEPVPAAVVKPVVKPMIKPRIIGVAARLNAYDTVNGKKVCDRKNDTPSVSGKGYGIHVDEDCCIDKDEVPNLNCYYGGQSKADAAAFPAAELNATKKLGSKYHK